MIFYPVRFIKALLELKPLYIYVYIYIYITRGNVELSTYTKLILRNALYNNL